MSRQSRNPNQHGSQDIEDSWAAKSSFGLSVFGKFGSEKLIGLAGLKASNVSRNSVVHADLYVDILLLLDG